MNKSIIFFLMVLLCPDVSSAQDVNSVLSTQQQTVNVGKQSVTWDDTSLIINGKRVVPVMGEIHYSRIPAEEWRGEIKKMKQGGVTIIATYIFWNHIEEQEGIFDWSGQRNLRHFLEICKEENMPVILRLGPFCHGEVRNGGIPDWFFLKGIKSRSEDPRFLTIVESLYRQIFTQVEGLQWKDGGPVIAAQFDNEYRGNGSYLMSLKKIALKIGFNLPFYTRTGWPELKTPVPYGEMLPLFGDYADGFWERSILPTAGNYYKAFFFKPNRDSKSIASEQIKYDEAQLLTNENKVSSYPYFTCELGGGMLTSYHRRPYMYAKDAYSMAVVKLGSGSNLLGYYMYHGGTNPEGKITYLNENQKTQATNYNDVPVKSYEFQAPLGEFGQKNETYYMLQPLHSFMHDFGELLAPMKAQFPDDGKEIKKGDDSYLRWSYRTDGKSAFVFFNNYERLQSLSSKKNISFNVCGVKFPRKGITIPAGAVGIFPVNVNIDGIDIRYATAQLTAQRGDTIFFMPVDGIIPEFNINGKIIYNPKSVVYKDNGKVMMLVKQGIEEKKSAVAVSYTKEKEAGNLRTITMGVNKVVEEPSDEDFESAAVYKINIGKKRNQLLSIRYQGDCARLYVDGKFIEDNFYNGRPMEYGLWRLPETATTLELRILPMQKDEQVYFPKEADVTPGEKVIEITCNETSKYRNKL